MSWLVSSWSLNIYPRLCPLPAHFLPPPRHVLPLLPASPRQGVEPSGNAYVPCVRSNLMAGGDNCSRSCLLGALMAAEVGRVGARGGGRVGGMSSKLNDARFTQSATRHPDIFHCLMGALTQGHVGVSLPHGGPHSGPCRCFICLMGALTQGRVGVSLPHGGPHSGPCRCEDWKEGGVWGG